MIYYWSSALIVFLLASLEVYSTSTPSSPTKSPKKKSTISASSSPKKIDSKILKNLNEFGRTPLKVTDRETTRLALDFDVLAEDNIYPSTLFFPKEESIYLKDSWIVPLYKIEDPKNLMNLKDKLADILSFLKEEIVDNSSSLSWVSNNDTLVNYILVVSTSITQLSYLNSRLSITNCPPEVSKRIYSFISEHLNTLTDFCSDIMGYSGRAGMTFGEGHLYSPEEYFENLFALREDKNVEMSDEMFQVFIEFFFGAYASDYTATVIKCYLDYVDSDRWAPLPIIYFRERMSIEYPDDFDLLISQWKLKIFNGERFDSRNLVNMGFLLQIGVFTQKTFFSLIDSAKVHQSQFKFNKEMIKFLTLLASTPWLLPEDQDAALLIGNFSFPSNGSEFSSNSEVDKKAMITFFWDFFAGSADFEEIEREEYENLCKLIQRLDLAFPGISESLWFHLKVKGSPPRFMRGDDNFELFQRKIESFEGIESLRDKIEFLKLNFSDDLTVESDLVDTKTLFLLFNFFTDIFSASVEVFLEEETEISELVLEHQIILNFCIKFFDTFLIKFAHKSVINYWYEKLDFYPTKLFDALNDLWMINREGFTNLTPVDCLIWENVAKLVDYNEKFARIFMTLLKVKTWKFRKPAFSSKALTPKCLIQNDEANSLNFEYFHEILVVSDGEIVDEFFSGLGEKLSNGEIFFDSVEILFKEILERNLLIKFSSYSQFWNPLLMIHLTKLESNSIRQYESINNSLRLYLKFNSKFEFTPEFLTNISVLMGFNQFIRGEIKSTAEAIGTEIDLLTISSSDISNSKELEKASSCLFRAFSRVIIYGVTARDSYRIVLNLVELAKVMAVFVFDYSNTALLGVVFAFNALLLSVIRIPDFFIPDEENSVLAFHEFYLNFKQCLPYYNENLMHVLRKRSSLVCIYRNLIKRSEALTASAFDLPIINDARTILKIQQGYIKMLGSKNDNMSLVNLNPITNWIKNGKIDPSTFLLLLKSINYDHYRIIANCIPLIAEFIKNDQIAVKLRVEALDIVFSQDNNDIIRLMANRRLFNLHENFIKLFVNGPFEVINPFLENCTDEDWYIGVKVEIERYENQKISKMDKRSANFYIKDEEYSKDLLEIMNASLPNYALRREVVIETDSFMAKMNHMLPILRDSVTNGPMVNCFFHLISANLEMTDALVFFKSYAKPETFLGLLKMQVLLFQKSLKRRTVLSWILESIRVPDTRKAVVRMFPLLIRSDSFVLCGGVLKELEKWFNETCEFEHFLGELVNSAFYSISVDLTIKSAPVFDEMLATLSEAFKKKIVAISSGFMIHHKVLDGLLKLKSERRDLIEQSRKLMEYLKYLVENEIGNELFTKVIELLKDFPSFYLNWKIEWIFIWKKLIQKLPFDFIENPSLNILSNFGNLNINEWKQILVFIPMDHLPKQVLIRLFIEIYDKETERCLEILQFLPDKIEVEDVLNFKDVEILLKYILYCLEYVENETEQLSEESYEKLFVLLDFDVKIGGLRDWDWRRILNHSNLDDEMERVVLNSFTFNFPNLLENSCCTVEAVLSFLYEINNFKDKTPPEFNEILLKAIEIYDKLSGTISNNFKGEECKFFDLLKRKIFVLMIENDSIHEVLALNLVTLKEIKEVLLEINCRERNDQYAIDTFAFILAVANKTFSSTFDSELLSEFSDLVVEMVYKILKFGNILGFAQVVDVMKFETLISSISYHVKERISEFNFIISESMKFAPIDVSDLFYQQISETDFRVDVCFFTRDIIEQFAIVTQEEFVIADASWPILYLSRLIKANDTLLIDGDHFATFECLLEQVSNEMLSDQILLTIGKLAIVRPNELMNIFTLIENLHKSFPDDFSLRSIREKFLINSVVKMLLKTSSVPFIRFLKEIQKKDLEEFGYCEWKHLDPEAQKILKRALQSEAEAVKTSIHTGVADKMIQRVSGIDFERIEQVENLLYSFKNLDAKFVEVPVMFALQNGFIRRLKETMIFNNTTKDTKGTSYTKYSDTNDTEYTSDTNYTKDTSDTNYTKDTSGINDTKDVITAIPIDHSKRIKSVQDCVKFLLNFPVFEVETFDDLVEIVLIVFSEEILLILVEKSETRERLKAILMTLRSRIDFNTWKDIKTKLQRFKLWEEEEILVSIAENSEPSQFIDLFSNFKNLSFSKKLELLENCRVVSGNEKVTKLIFFYKNLLSSFSSSSSEENLMIGLKSMMRNEIISNCFLSNQKNNLKNKLTILSLLKNNLPAREIIKLADSSVMKIVVNLYFKASSTKDSIIPSTSVIDFVILKEILNCYFYEIQNDSHIKNKTPMYMKAFRLYKEIEDRFGVMNLIEGGLESMTEGLMVSLKSSKNFISSPETIYAIYKLTRRLMTKKRERYSIIRNLLLSSKYLRVDCFEAFLKAQLDSGSIDWELHRELEDNAQGNQRILDILFDFETEHYT